MLSTLEFENLDLFNYYQDIELFPQGDKHHYSIAKNEIELTCSPVCDQRCAYCYLQEFQKELYPIIPQHKELIHNIDLFFDYIYNQRYTYFYTINIFGGDIIYNNTLFDILDLLDKYFAKIYQNEPGIFENRLTRIIIPNNLQWVVKAPEKVLLFREYFHRFRQVYNTRIMFSWSCDGPFGNWVRENQELDDYYYDTILRFCLEFNAGFHPMISAAGADYLIENYDWWLEQYRRYNFKLPFDFQPMMLEVRNDDWTDGALLKYCEFLSHVFEKRMEMVNYDIANFARHYFIGDGDKGTLPSLNNYDCLVIRYRNFNGMSGIQEKISCDIQACIYFNANELSLIPCHRTCYPQFVGAYFITDDKKEHITGIKPHNLNAYITIRSCKDYLLPKCNSCKYNAWCIKGCLGSNYENTNELFFPPKTVCKLFETKIKHIVKLLCDSGVYQYALDNNVFISEADKQGWIDLVEEVNGNGKK